jgi:hypothetical protein
MEEERCPCEDLTDAEILAVAETFAGEGRIPKDLGQYWTRGPGAAKIRWGIDGAFNRCVRLLRQKVKNPGIDIKGLCANLHKRATGEWPAEKGIDS